MNVVFQSAANMLVVLFLLGLAGSLFVIVVTFLEDLELLFDEESTDASAKT